VQQRELGVELEVGQRDGDVVLGQTVGERDRNR
jgi:hypothetical protein